MKTTTTKRPAGYGEWVEVCYAYEGWHGREARCGLRIFQPAGKLAVVVVTELPDNPGTSVTNRAEYLATRIAQQFGLVRFVWVEHYLASTVAPEHFSLVKFTCEDSILLEPSWKPLTEAALRDLVA